MTFLLRTKTWPFYAPLVAALAVADTLDSYIKDVAGNEQQKFKIKWINDVHHLNRKLSGTLCTCTNIDEASFSSIGIGVNLNSNPIADTSVCLQDVTATSDEIDVDEFVERLANRVVLYFSHVDKYGFVGELLLRITAKLDFMGEQVHIFDEALTNIIHTGKFIGINSYGHARLLQADGTTIETMEGRMRRATANNDNL